MESASLVPFREGYRPLLHKVPGRFALDLDVEIELRRKMKCLGLRPLPSIRTPSTPSLSKRNHDNGDVEWFLIGKTKEHVNETSIRMIFVSRGANDIFS
ncbi:hypothetical protein Tco_0759207 [Tanacetum coccineum]